MLPSATAEPGTVTQGGKVGVRVFGGCHQAARFGICRAAGEQPGGEGGVHFDVALAAGLAVGGALVLLAGYAVARKRD